MHNNLKKMQQKALNYMLSGGNVFLTGEAGTGKSYVTNCFIEECTKRKKNILVTAPTGISAINIHGSTLHRTFQIPVKPLLETEGIVKVPKTVRTADIIIIDEISMCRADIFDYVARVIEMAEKIKRKKIQLIVIGDFLQLPPVTPNQEANILKNIYPNSNKFYAFESNRWNDFNFQTVILDEIVRQSDPVFVSELNKARIGNPQCISFFNKKYSTKFTKNGITLVGTNKKALEINERELAKLPGRERLFHADYLGKFKPSDCLADEWLKLKVGARVMSLVNDKADRYQNGTFGTVVDLNPQYVVVRFDNGYECKITSHTWENVTYEVFEDTDSTGKKVQRLDATVIGTCDQIPLKLAYAVTIHKSQGQTFEKVNLYPQAFDVGQLYVALSRVKSLDGLVLCSKIIPWYLKSDQNVIDFYNTILQ